MSSSPLLNNRLSRLSDYPFTRLANLLADLSPPADVKPVMLSLGEPQHAPPALIDETLRAHAHLWGKYPPVAGTPEFRAAAGDWLRRRYRAPEGAFDPEVSLLPVVGTREALFMAAQLTTPERKAGQTPIVLMPNPFYAVYQGAAMIAGAEAMLLPATAETGFLPDLEALSPSVLERVSLFYLCTPANPQGAAADLAYLRRALSLARQYGFVLAVDECYSEIYVSERPPVGAMEAALSLGETAGGVWSNLLVFHSLSKRSSAAGLRSGFVAGDPTLIQAFARLRSYGNAGAALPVLAAATALWRDEAHVEDNRRRYREKFDAAEAALQGKFDYVRPDGGFFLWLNVGDGEAATRALWREGGLRVLPGAYLSQADAAGRNPGHEYIRVALVQEPETIGAACGTMARILS